MPIVDVDATMVSLFSDANDCAKLGSYTRIKYKIVSIKKCFNFTYTYLTNM
jgi:hypothetical protein